MRNLPYLPQRRAFLGHKAAELPLLQSISTALCPGQFSKEQSDSFLKHRQTEIPKGLAPLHIINAPYNHAQYGTGSELPMRHLPILCHKPLPWNLQWTLLPAASLPNIHVLTPFQGAS